MVLALSGSGVGRTYLAQQYPLLQDLFSLLHTGTPRIQRQVMFRVMVPDYLRLQSFRAAITSHFQFLN